MNGGNPPSEDDPEQAFSLEAEAAGIVLPKKHHTDPWDVVVIVVALIVLTAGIGEVTGWINLRSGSPPSGGFETQSCSGTPVQTYGTVSSALDPAFASWLDLSAQQLSQAVGGCFHVDVNATAGNGYVPPLGGPHSEFAATYTTPTQGETGGLPSPIVVVPVALSAVAIIYNVPGAPNGLNLSTAVLAGMFLGTITSWNDSAITALNPGVSLSAAPPITTFHRSGATVTNEVLTDFLANGDPAWRSAVGDGLSVSWPVGTGTPTDAAMLAQVAATPGAVGYIEIFGTGPSGVGSAQLEDAAGDFAPAGSVGVWVAANSLANDSAVTTGNWSNFSLANASASGSYPLSVLSYVGIYRDLGVAYGGSLSLSNAAWLLTYLYWLTGTATVAPLPPAFVADALGVLDNETYMGTTIVHLESENGETGESGGETGEF